jgi:hypothetical protein
MPGKNGHLAGKSPMAAGPGPPSTTIGPEKCKIRKVNDGTNPSVPLRFDAFRAAQSIGWMEKIALTPAAWYE